MAAIVAAPGPGVPLPPDELLLKGHAEKTEEELGDDDDQRLGSDGEASGEDPVRNLSHFFFLI